MSDEIRRQLADWRDSFDRGFAEPLRSRADEASFDVLGIRIAGAAFALDLADLAGLMPAMPPAPYPATAPGLLGLIGHQGQVLPLYDLQTLIGRGSASATHWWAVVRAAPLALAFEGFDGQWRIAASDRLQQSDAAGAGWAVRCGGALRPLLALDEVVATVTGRLAAATATDTDTDTDTTTTADPIGS